MSNVNFKSTRAKPPPPTPPTGEMNKSITASVCLFGDEGESFHWSVRPQILQIVPRCFISRPNRRHQRLRASFLIYIWINNNDERFSEMKHGLLDVKINISFHTTRKEDDCVSESMQSNTVNCSGPTARHAHSLFLCWDYECDTVVHSNSLCFLQNVLLWFNSFCSANSTVFI